MNNNEPIEKIISLIDEILSKGPNTIPKIIDGKIYHPYIIGYGKQGLDDDIEEEFLLLELILHYEKNGWKIVQKPKKWWNLNFSKKVHTILIYSKLQS